MVVASHVSATPGFPPSLSHSRYYDGSLGVEVFFVISGYLITWLLLDEEERRGTIGLRAFYRRRALRILPAAFVYLGAIALIDLLVRPIANYGDIVAAVTSLATCSAIRSSRGTSGACRSRSSSTSCGRRSSWCSPFATG